MASMVQYRSCVESELDSRPIIAGSFILCTDTGNLFHDTEDGDRIRVSKSIHFLGSESDRTSMLTADSDVLYIVLATGKMYLYGSNWVCINKTTEYYYLHNISVPAKGSVSISDSRIKVDDTGKFTVNPELIDLVTEALTCACTTGNVTVTNPNAYIINGIVEITTIE